MGTDDTPTTGFWSTTNLTGTDMTKVAEYEYDNGGVGDGNVTKVTQFPGGGAANRVTQTFYDWRNRPVAVKSGVETTESTSVNRPIQFSDYDNLGHVTKSRMYDGDAVTIASTGGVPNAPSASLLRGQSTTTYDEFGRAYRSDVYSVDPSSGSVGSYTLQSNTWFDKRGQVVKSSAPGGLVQKVAYDGVGRTTASYTTDGGGDTAWSDAFTVTGDTVLSQNEIIHDASGLALLTTNRQRFHDETGTGALGTPTTGVKARVSYAANYYDAGDRPLHGVFVGTNGGSTYTRPGSVLSRSDTVLVNSTEYDSAGRAFKSIDPKGLENRTYFDALGRTVKTIANYVDGTVSDTDDKTTEYAFGPAGMISLTAKLTGGGGQTTEWVYGVTAGGGSAVTSNDVISAVKFPDPSTGSASSSSQDVYAINALGNNITYTDRNGSAHTYTFDVMGRLTADAVTTLGSGVNGAVRRIEVGYDAQGNSALFTSYDAASGGTVVNQISRDFNGLGQLTSEWQDHAGAVTGSTPRVQYAHAEMSFGANHSRPISMTYPNGKILTFNYASGLDATLSRISSLSDTTGTLESYSYLGLDTVARRTRPQPGIDETLYKLGGEADGDAGDKYTGSDRFGRIVDERWVVAATGVAVDRYQYGYDRDSNPTYRDNLANTAFGEVYAYDGLNQLTSYDRGTLNSTKTVVTGSPARSQAWDYDATGNWESVSTNGSPQTRTHDKQNKVASVGGATTPTYNPNGNLTKDQNGQQYVYNAWNNVVQVKDASGTAIADYQYDGVGRRVARTVGGTTTHLYYSVEWQVLEERVGSVVTAQYVWGLGYIDSLVLRDRDTDANGSLDERLWAIQDANYNVTALVNATGSVVERYAYDPFGTATVYDASWGVRSGGSSYIWTYLHQGLPLDAATGLYYARYRDVHPTFGRPLQRDPLGFGAGDLNTYRWEANAPVGLTDPYGLAIRLAPDADYHGTPEEAMENKGSSYRDNCAQVSDFFAGWADSLTSGGTRKVRQACGYDDGVDTNSSGYTAGGVVGDLHSQAIPACKAGRLGGVVRGINRSAAVSNGIDAVEAAVDGDLETAIEKGLDARSHAKAATQPCFAAGTPVRTADGHRMIETLRAGDRVLSRDEHDPAAAIVEETITEAFARVAPIVVLRVGGKELRTTAEHPFFTEGRGWVPAGMLEPGERLLAGDGQWLPVELAKPNGEVVTVYNFEVRERHTYFVGDPAWWGFDLWTHNHNDNLGPNGGKRNPADQKRIDEQRQLRAQRREAESRNENGQNPRNAEKHEPADKGPRGIRPTIEGGRNRERNVGIDEEHSRVAKGSCGKAR